MGFQQLGASFAARDEGALSADTRPDRFRLVEVLGKAARDLGLGPSVVATVDALLSCLPPKRRHDVVFASNATLVARRNGISDRTLRRHLAELVAAGLIARIDSPNGKRYAKSDPTQGVTLRFGLDMAPLFAAFPRIKALAQERDMLAQRLAYLRCKLRAALARTPEAPDTMRLALRRAVTADALEAMLSELAEVTALETEEMAASNSQNVRHHQNSEKELIEREISPEISAEDLTTACPEAASFLMEPAKSIEAVIAHGRRLAPMLGIDPRLYQAAETARGRVDAALTIWVLMELQSKIRNLGGYFRAITRGAKAHGFDPRLWISQRLQRTDCPRTILRG